MVLPIQKVVQKLDAGDVAEAREMLEYLLQVNPGSENIWLYYARSVPLGARGGVLRAGLEHLPHSIKLLAELAQIDRVERIYGFRGKHGESLEDTKPRRVPRPVRTASRIVKISDDTQPSTSNLISIARECIHRQDMKTAQTVLEQVMDADPEHEEAWLHYVDTLPPDDLKGRIDILQDYLAINLNSPAAIERLTAYRDILSREQMRGLEDDGSDDEENFLAMLVSMGNEDQEQAWESVEVPEVPKPPTTAEVPEALEIPEILEGIEVPETPKAIAVSEDPEPPETPEPEEEDDLLAPELDFAALMESMQAQDQSIEEIEESQDQVEEQTLLSEETIESQPQAEEQELPIEALDEPQTREEDQELPIEQTAESLSQPEGQELPTGEIVEPQTVEKEHELPIEQTVKSLSQEEAEELPTEKPDEPKADEKAREHPKTISEFEALFASKQADYKEAASMAKTMPSISWDEPDEAKAELDFEALMTSLEVQDQEDQEEQEEGPELEPEIDFAALMNSLETQDQAEQEEGPPLGPEIDLAALMTSLETQDQEDQEEREEGPPLEPEIDLAALMPSLETQDQEDQEEQEEGLPLEPEIDLAALMTSMEQTQQSSAAEPEAEAEFVWEEEPQVGPEVDLGDLLAEMEEPPDPWESASELVSEFSWDKEENLDDTLEEYPGDALAAVLDMDQEKESSDIQEPADGLEAVFASDQDEDIEDALAAILDMDQGEASNEIPEADADEEPADDLEAVFASDQDKDFEDALAAVLDIEQEKESSDIQEADADEEPTDDLDDSGGLDFDALMASIAQTDEAFVDPAEKAQNLDISTPIDENAEGFLAALSGKKEEPKIEETPAPAAVPEEKEETLEIVPDWLQAAEYEISSEISMEDTPAVTLQEDDFPVGADGRPVDLFAPTGSLEEEQLVGFVDPSIDPDEVTGILEEGQEEHPPGPPDGAIISPAQTMIFDDPDAATGILDDEEEGEQPPAPPQGATTSPDYTVIFDEQDLWEEEE